MSLNSLSRRYPKIVGFAWALVAIAIGYGAWTGWGQYRKGTVSHAQAQVSAEILLYVPDKKFIIKDGNGKERPATVADIIVALAKQIAKDGAAQQASAPGK